MASTYIDVSGNASRLAGMTRGLIDQARDMQNATNKIKAIMDTAKDGTVDEAASFVTLGGLLGVTSTNAREVYNALVAFQAVINKAAYDTFVNRLG